jgi:hypothetical protein
MLEQDRKQACRGRLSEIVKALSYAVQGIAFLGSEE